MDKKLENKEIMAQVLDALDVTAMKFASRTKLHRNTVYNILKGAQKEISRDNIDKIIQAYPKVNKDFLKNGIYPILKENGFNEIKFDKSQTTQSPDQNLYEILTIPQRIGNIEESLKRIEAKLDQLLSN